MADLSVTAASVVSVDGGKSSALAGEAITAGQSVYVKASDGRVYKAQADGTVAEAEATGIALNGGATGQPIQYQTDGTLTIGATTAKGVAYVVSAAAGGVCPIGDLTSGQYITFLGYATNISGGFALMKKVTGITV